ncbi:MAG TPA: DinB family protein, partial [Longimicrobiales bacterium]
MEEYARPGPDEYADHYAGYVRRVPPGPVLTILERQLEETLALLRPLDEEQAAFRYAPGKWSIKEVLGHLVDTERVFGYRALWFARGYEGPLPPFEQDDFVRAGGFDRRTLADLLEELRIVR